MTTHHSIFVLFHGSENWKINMKIDMLLYIFSASFLLTIRGQDDVNTLRNSYLSLFPQTSLGCKHEMDTRNSRCVSRAYCNQFLNVGWTENCFTNTRYECPNTFYYQGELMSETYYAFINIQNLDTLDGSNAAKFVTSLDLRYNNFENAPTIPQMQHLVTLNISGNNLIAAKLYNENLLEQLTEIDFSHNKISTILVNEDYHVYRHLKNIYLSNNRLVALGDGIFSLFPKLENIDLSFNYIDTLNILTFNGLKNVINLNLRHNEISELDHFLIRFSKLENLDLSFNKIQNIKTDDFEPCVNLEVLKLNSNLIANIDKNVFDKKPKLRVLNLGNNYLQQIPNETWVNLSKLTEVDLSNNDLKFLPINLFKDKNILKFSVSRNNLEGKLVKFMFKGLKLDGDFDLSNQQLTAIEDFAFYGLENLKQIFLNNNHLQSISKTSFATLRSLEVLDLSNNQLTNIDFNKDDLINLQALLLRNNRLIKITPECFYGLSNLIFLDLGKNNISVLGSSTFMSLKALTNLQVLDNPLTGTIDKNCFKGLEALPILDLSGTLLTTIKNGSFNGMNQLKEFNASHNKITQIEFNSFLNTGLIEKIDLSFNELTYFDVNTTELLNLHTLVLNNNSIISFSFLNELSHLSNIFISQNQIEFIDGDTFKYQKNIKYLDISYNHKLNLDMSIFKEMNFLVTVILSGIHTNVTFDSSAEVKISHLEMTNSNICNISQIGLRNIKNLSYLNLSNNKITKVDTLSFYGVKTITELDLSFNNITFIQPGAFKDNSLLRYLNVSHNKLIAVNYGIFKGLSQLYSLDMSYNDIRDLENERFYEVRSLKTLIADHNKISNVMTDDFLGTNIAKLSIGDNPIPCHILVKFKKANTGLIITALNLDESSDKENVDGVTCNMETSEIGHVKHDKNAPNNSLIADIRDILHNLSATINKREKYVVENSPNESYSLQDTNMLLEKVINVLSVMSNNTARPLGVEDKNFQVNPLSNDVKFSSNYHFDSESLVYVKVVVGLMVVLIMLVLLFLYLSFSFNRHRFFYTTRPNDILDNSSL